MGWTEEVHESRANTSIKRAREQRQLKRANAPVQVPNTNAGPAAFTVGLSFALSALLLKRYEDQLRQIEWSKLPIIKQFHSLISGKPLSGPAYTKRPKARPAASPATVSAAGKPKVGKTTKPISPTQAAADAAMARQSGASAPAAASTSSNQTSKKKKKGKH